MKKNKKKYIFLKVDPLYSKYTGMDIYHFIENKSTFIGFPLSTLRLYGITFVTYEQAQ